MGVFSCSGCGGVLVRGSAVGQVMKGLCLPKFGICESSGGIEVVDDGKKSNGSNGKGLRYVVGFGKTGYWRERGVVWPGRGGGFDGIV